MAITLVADRHDAKTHLFDMRTTHSDSGLDRYQEGKIARPARPASSTWRAVVACETTRVRRFIRLECRAFTYVGMTSK